MFFFFFEALRVFFAYFFTALFAFFFAFFAFLAMLPSAIPKLVQCKSTSTCINTEYTTITKLILRASKKVNGGHTVARCGWANLFHEASTRYADTACCPARNFRTEIDMQPRRKWQAARS